MARAADETRVIDLDAAEVRVTITSFLENKAVVDDATKRMKVLQPMIVEWLKESVDPDSDGNHEYALSEPVAGYVRLNLVRVVKTSTDEDAVERILRAKGLANCLKVITVPDEDAIAMAAINGDLTEEDMAEMFPQAVSHRLMTPKK